MNLQYLSGCWPLANQHAPKERASGKLGSITGPLDEIRANRRSDMRRVLTAPKANHFSGLPTTQPGNRKQALRSFPTGIPGSNFPYGTSGQLRSGNGQYAGVVHMWSWDRNQFQQAAELREDLLQIFIAKTEQNPIARTTCVLMGSHGDSGYLMIGSPYSTSVSPFLAMRSS